MIVNSETMEFEVIPNTAAGAVGGAGIQAAKMKHFLGGGRKNPRHRRVEVYVIGSG